MGRMNAHDCVVTKAAYQPGFLAVVRAKVLVVGDAISKREPQTDRGPVEPTGKIDPFAAVASPGLTAECNRNLAGD